MTFKLPVQSVVDRHTRIIFESLIREINRLEKRIEELEKK